MAAPGVRHEAPNATAGARVRGAPHIQTANNRHGQSKGILRDFRGVAAEIDRQLLAMVLPHRLASHILPENVLRCSNRKVHVCESTIESSLQILSLADLQYILRL